MSRFFLLAILVSVVAGVLWYLTTRWAEAPVSAARRKEDKKLRQWNNKWKKIK